MWSLKCTAQNYAWGKLGKDSAVAKFRKNAEDAIMGEKGSFVVDDNKPYAELWMGTHPSGPAQICTKDQGDVPLLDFIKQNQHFIGSVPDDYPADDLPFMFKVLSIRTALSIQAHPDKRLARKLHKEFPTVYKDGNHKPEMAIALTDFEGMMGFRPVIEIRNHFDRYPELAAICGAEAVRAIETLAPRGGKYDWTDEFYSSSGLGDLRNEENGSYGVKGSAEWNALRDLVLHLLDYPEADSDRQLATLISRLEAEEKAAVADGRPFAYVKGLILRLNQQYPGDRGILFPLLLNTVHMRAGQSFYMGANEPHAYVSGDILECMALSDNVVRVGLTPKFKDKDTLTTMLHYHSCNVNFLHPERVDACTYVYRPPSRSCAEFEIERVVLPCKSGGFTYSLQKHACASIIIFIGGSGPDTGATMAWEGNGEKGETQPVPAVGSCTFLAAGVTLTITTGSEVGMELYRSHINLGDTSGRSRFNTGDSVEGGLEELVNSASVA
jgi:mannose-6-phosphate isomerase